MQSNTYTRPIVDERVNRMPGSYVQYIEPQPQPQPQLQSPSSRPTVDDRVNRMLGSYAQYGEPQPQPPPGPLPQTTTRLRVRPQSRKRSVSRDDAVFSDTASNTPTVGSDSEISTPKFSRKNRAVKIPSRPTTYSLASRFSRGTPSTSTASDKTKNTVRFSLPDDSTEDDLLSPDVETASLSSELSTDTQATTVGSDCTVTKSPPLGPVSFESPSLPTTSAGTDFLQYDPSQNSARRASALPAPSALSAIGPVHNRIVARRVPTPPTVRVKPRTPQAHTRPSFDNQVVKTSPPQTARRTLHIEVSPAESFPETDHHELELHKKSERDLIEKINKLELETKSLRDGQTKLIKDLDDASEKLSTTGHEKAVAKKERNQERLSKERLLHDLDEQRRILDEFRSNFEFQKGLLEDVERERDMLKVQKGALTLRVGDLESYIAKLETKVTKLEDDVSYEKKQLVELEQRHKDKDEALIQQIAALELAKGVVDGNLDMKSKEIVALNSENSAVRDESDKRQEQIELLTNEKKALENGQERLQACVVGLEDEKQDLKTGLDLAMAEIAELKAHIVELDLENDDLATKLDDSDAAKDALRKELDVEMVALKATLATDKDTYKADMDAEKADIQRAMDALAIEIDGVKTANISLASQKLDAEKAAAALQDALTAAEVDITILKADVKSLEAENARLAAATKDLEAQRAADADNVDALRQQLAALETAKAALEDSTTDLQARADQLPALEQAKTDLEAQIAALQAAADNASLLADEKAALATQAAALQARLYKIPTLDSDRAAFDTEKAAFDGQKADLEQRAAQLPALVERNAALNGQLAAMQARVDQLVLETQALLSAQLALAQQQQQQQQQQSQAGSSSRSHSRSSSKKRSRSTSVPPKKVNVGKAGGSEREKEKDKLVVVRSPTDRGSMQIIRKSELYALKARSSAASTVSGHSSD